MVGENLKQLIVRGLFAYLNKFLYFSTKLLDMKKLILTIVSLLFLTSSSIKEDKVDYNPCEQNLDLIIPLLWEVESNSRTGVIKGDWSEEKQRYRAYGGMQIWNAVVLDVNRIYGTEYTHSDMFNITKAKDVAKKYLEIGIKHYKKKYNKEPSEEEVVKMYNGGAYNGYNYHYTEKYWKKYLAVKGSKNVINESKL